MDMQQYGAELWKTWREATAAYNAFAKKEGVESGDLYLVDALWEEEGGLTQRVICEYTDMNKQTVSAICKRLVARRHLESLTSPDDGRARIMRLTPAGRAAWKGPIERLYELEARAMGTVSEEDALVFLRVSQQYAAAMAEELQR